MAKPDPSGLKSDRDVSKQRQHVQAVLLKTDR